MSQRYLGGFITDNPVQPTSSYAQGEWTLQQQFQHAGNWPFGGPFIYVDDVFSTYLWTGTGASNTINNGIDLADNGGMVWIKSRSNSKDNVLTDTVRGTNSQLLSDLTSSQVTLTNTVTSFNSNGFTLGVDSTNGWVNLSSLTYVGWTFRKQPKFFDIVQYTGTGSPQAINHNLGSTPGMIIIKTVTAGQPWAVYSKGLNNGVTPEQYYLLLNTTDAQTADSSYWNNIAPTSTQFTVGTSNRTNSASGFTYIAYLFADQAGGFGSTGTDSAIACGSFTTDGSGNLSVNLGWEPQYVMIKETSASGSWFIFDVMRGFSNTQDQYLQANTPAAENSSNASPSYLTPNATGFVSGQAGFFAGSASFIYIAIRRPNKPPTTGTSVFAPVAGTGATPSMPTSFVVDAAINLYTPSYGGYPEMGARLVGNNPYFMSTASTSAEGTYSDSDFKVALNQNTGFGGSGYSNSTWVGELFRRAPTFFDVVCYTGTGSATTINHNLTVPAEMMIVKKRNGAAQWEIYNSTLGNIYTTYFTSGVPNYASYWNFTDPTSTVFSVDGSSPVNGSGFNFVAYLFATCAGVSKVGSYTGNATGQSIACGFGSGGARFILIKRTDDVGNWYCFDSANGLTSSSSPYELLNTTAAQTTGNNGVYASSGGFTLTSNASSTVNINGGSYIFLAIS